MSGDNHNQAGECDLDAMEARAALITTEGLRSVSTRILADDVSALVAEVRRLRGSVAEARRWIINCVDPAEVGVEAKVRMLDALDPA